MNIKGNISTIHSYNRRKVKEEDIPKYGKAAIDYIIFPAITIGLAFILYGQIKYNHGIF